MDPPIEPRRKVSLTGTPRGRSFQSYVMDDREGVSGAVGRWEGVMLYGDGVSGDDCLEGREECISFTRVDD